MIIQIILLFIIALIILRLIAKKRSKELTGKQFSGWLLIWLLAAIVVIWPDLTVRLANLVGIGRGADLVVYSALIFLFYFIFRLLLRIEKMEKNLTKIVREEALKDYGRQE
jgi:hypothetical protein